MFRDGRLTAALTGYFSTSVAKRILFAFVGIYLVTYFATAVVVYSGVRASVLDSHAAALDQYADLKYKQLTNIVGALGTDLVAWSELDVMNDLVSGDIDKRIAKTLEGLKRLYQLSGEIYAFDAGGTLLASSRSAGFDGPARRLPAQWQRQTPGLVLLDKHTDPMTGNDAMAFAIPVFGNFDRSFRIGTLVMTYPWRSVETALFSLDYGTLLLGRDGQLLAADPSELAGLAHAFGGQPGAAAPDRRFIVGRSLPQGPLLADWQVLALQDIGTVTSPLRWVAGELVLLGIFLAFPIILLGRWLARRVTAPIAGLTRVVHEIADTDKLDARAPVTSADELGSLAQSFNRMTDNLQKATREREQYLGELAALNQTLEAKIAARTAELEGAIRAQRRLIGDISHEIKSPLARLSMALGLARRLQEAGNRKQFDRIETEIGNISALATELLTLAKLDGAEASPELAEIDLGPLLDRIVADAVFEKPQRAPDIVLDKPAGPVLVLGNAELLRRAVENVVRNAMFYTGDGTEVTIALRCPAPDQLTIAVADRGPGVPPSAIDHLFEPFFRVDEARARETGGSGIGLAICRRVVQLHGGSVRAAGTLPHGLTVEITLPRR